MFKAKVADAFNYIQHLDQRKIKLVLLSAGVILIIIAAVLGISAFAHSNSVHYLVQQNDADSSTQFELTPYSYQTAVKGVSILPQFKTVLGAEDTRAYVLDQYFKADNSPLYGTGRLFVQACDKYGAPKDCTTVAAIARAETDLCKYSVSAEQFNCWGFGGGGADRIQFNSWAESIDLVTDRLVNRYGNQYMLDPSLMEDTFCGSEPGCTGWGNRVKFFMNDISEYSKKLGFTKSLFDYRT